MSQKCISTGGYPVEVATPTDPVTIPAATATVIGGVKKGATVAACTVAADGTSAGTQLNALIASLKAAGVIA
ncbi:head fiber protein [Lelliottia sp. V89_10]|uniref:head fiber protein n=1 Tax=Lelliottia wanjuensis TaxID=3050585 RepID=UPI00249F5296|nr:MULTISPECIES: head fiber protein [unclassified Lelliottia]MDI3361160.1 head fiber protein [Lelliottia sp. V89_13]MDK9551259.1 head fiber protein [Lelliottia sp. V89_5]MDK9597469.1 head fiber protein [Lelliottia sp. V89_10]